MVQFYTRGNWVPGNSKSLVKDSDPVSLTSEFSVWSTRQYGRPSGSSVRTCWRHSCFPGVLSSSHSSFCSDGLPTISTATLAVNSGVPVLSRCFNQSPSISWLERGGMVLMESFSSRTKSQFQHLLVVWPGHCYWTSVSAIVKGG